RCRHRPGGRGYRQRHLLQPGTRVLRRFAAVRAGVGSRRGRAETSRAHGDADHRRPARQEHRHRRDQFGGATGTYPCLPEDRRGRGRRDAPEFVPGARSRLLVPADYFHRRLAIEPHRAGGNFRAGACGADLPHAGRGPDEGKQHGLRLVRRHLDGQGGEDLQDDAGCACRCDLGKHVQQVRPDFPLRRLQGERCRTRRRPARPRRVPGPGGAAIMSAASRVAVAKTYKIYIDGKFPRTESGRYFALEDKDGHVIANVSRGSRKDFRNAVVAARNAFGKWSSASAYLRGQILYRIAEMLEGQREQFIAELVTQAISKRRAAAEVDACTDRIVYYAGWADKYQQIFSAVNPVSSSHFNFSVLEPTGVVAIIAPD